MMCCLALLVPPIFTQRAVRSVTPSGGGDVTSAPHSPTLSSEFDGKEFDFGHPGNTKAEAQSFLGALQTVQFPPFTAVSNCGFSS